MNEIAKRELIVLVHALDWHDFLQMADGEGGGALEASECKVVEWELGCEVLDEALAMNEVGAVEGIELDEWSELLADKAGERGYWLEVESEFSLKG